MNKKQKLAAHLASMGFVLAAICAMSVTQSGFLVLAMLFFLVFGVICAVGVWTSGLAQRLESTN